jgi:hypothetical protein
LLLQVYFTFCSAGGGNHNVLVQNMVSIASSGSVQAEVCSMYGEWLHLNEKTRGGFFYGTDPSYGGDLSGRNHHGASYAFYDNARYVTLSKIFGRGFIPIGCP